MYAAINMGSVIANYILRGFMISVRISVGVTSRRASWAIMESRWTVVLVEVDQHRLRMDLGMQNFYRLPWSN